jgi:glutamine amidotransferase
MLQAAGGQSQIITAPAEAIRARRLILPGVGAFDAGMEALEARGWLDVLPALVLKKRVPILGICLGMQMLCRRSDEGSRSGLGWINADVVAFDGAALGLKVPHMGWAVVDVPRENPLIPMAEGEYRFYHVHKYHVVCDDPQDVMATAKYGTAFVTGVWHQNIFGVQFHPEKSHRFGLSLLARFLQVPC